ncbi:HEAT repeat domain-containing protein [Streptomyces sp. NBC_01643]|uniref:HEAT repeat domain-containing protein n=1 Tax=Streptomyces sp. NBC_01643 TaxID=2975906 RepID=UPI00386D769B|nr:HEAT repeat domain-containing protein [Streptomyces sp. NBC_01643]
MADRFPEITSVEEFIRLRQSEDPAEFKRSAWATLPLPVWWDLVRNHPDIRFWVAHNRTVPPEILAELIEDPDWRVRDRVASKRNCPSELLERLVDDPHDSVRRLVAGHPRSLRSAVARLVDDPWPVVAQEARVRLAKWPSAGTSEPS